MAAKDKAALMRETRQRRKAQGLVQFLVWIPDTQEAREAVRRLADKLTRRSKAEPPESAR